MPTRVPVPSTPDAALKAFPRVSMVLLAYNQADIVTLAAKSCLAQDCPPIEIILSDDASSDATHQRLLDVAAGYTGPHCVKVRRNETNVGIGEHYNLLLQAASGELIVTAAGDDISVSDRVNRLVAAWDANGRRADLISSHVVDMDGHGGLHGVKRVDDLARYHGIGEWLEKRPYIIGASHAYTRRLMQRFGPMLPGIAYEDQIMVFRAILSGGALTVDAPLVQYRRGGESAAPAPGATEDIARWSRSQLGRMLAEMRQLIADARLAGFAPLVEELFAKPMQDREFALGMLTSRSFNERWRALRAAPLVPFGWRFRKVLNTTFPGATKRVKGALRLFQRRHWRARRAGRR